MSHLFLLKQIFLFRKKKKNITTNKKWKLKRPNLLTGLGSIKNHNDTYRERPLLLSLINRGCSFSKKSSKLLIPRLEVYRGISFFGTNTIQGKTIAAIIMLIRHSKYTVKFKKITNLFIHDLVFSYKGWRHFKGLPTRGQKSRTNAKITKQCNVDMRELKCKLLKSYYKNIQSNLIAIGSLVEAYNRLWYTQWKHEWNSSRIRRIKFNKLTNKVCVYDFSSTAAGRIVGYYRKAKAGKKKRVYKDNHFTIGLRKGETKLLLSSAAKKPSGSVFTLPDGSIAQVLVQAAKEKKKISKKMSSTKKKTRQVS